MLYKKSLPLIRIKEAGFVLRKKCFLCRKSDYRKLILLPIIWIIPSENFSRFCKESLSYDDTPFGFKMQASFMFFWKKNPKKFFCFLFAVHIRTIFFSLLFIIHIITRTRYRGVFICWQSRTGEQQKEREKPAEVRRFAAG